MNTSTSIMRLDTSVNHPLWIEGQCFTDNMPHWQSPWTTKHTEYPQMRDEIALQGASYVRKTEDVALWCLFNALYFTDQGE